jgi:hypothetical protein
MDDED